MRPRSILDRFFRPDQQNATRDVLEACASLLDPNAAATDRSHGEVTSGDTLLRAGDPTFVGKGGIFCPAIFGPFHELRCRCGRVSGTERRGEICSECGVICTDEDLRALRFGHLSSPLGLVHPALVGAIAGAIGWRPEDVLAFAHCTQILHGSKLVPFDEEQWDDADWLKTGPMLLERLLSEAGASATLLVSSIPVLPPGDRPLAGDDDPSVRVEALGPINVFYRSLWANAARSRRLIELGAPTLLLAMQTQAVQRRFEELLAAIVPSEAASSVEPLPESEPTPASSLGGAPAASERPRGPTLPLACLFLDAERALVQVSSLAFVVELATGSVVSAHGVGGWIARATNAEGRRVAFIDPSASLPVTDVITHAGILDLSTGSWLTEFPEAPPLVAVGHLDPEEPGLVQLRARVMEMLPPCGDRPKLRAHSRGNRFIWIGEGADGIVVATATSKVHLDAESLELDQVDGPYLGVDGRLRDEPRREIEEGACAVALRDGRKWWLVGPNGAVRGEGEHGFVLDFEARAVAFDEPVSRLLVATKTDLLVIQLAQSPSIEHRYDLKPLLAIARRRNPEGAIRTTLPRKRARARVRA